MFVTNSEALKQATFETSDTHQFDKDGKPIFKGDGSGIDYSKVKPV